MSKYLYTERGFVSPLLDEPRYGHDREQWDRHVLSLPAIPAADPSKFIVGNWYEEGKDFELKCVMCEQSPTSKECLPSTFAVPVYPSQGLSEEDKPPLRLKQYGVNDLSPVSETPVFTERMKWFAQQLKDHNVPEHIADAMMNPIHGNQAGFEAANKAMEEIEKAEIEREAEAWAEKDQSTASE